MKNRTLKSAASLAFVLLLPFTGAATCNVNAPPGGGGANAPDCEISTDAPGEKGNLSGLELTGSGYGTYVVGTLWVNCNPAPQEHHLVIKLLWTAPGKGAKAMVVSTGKSDTIPPPTWASKSTAHVCITGTWQLDFSVTGVSSTGQPYVETPDPPGLAKVYFSTAQCHRA